MARAETRTIYCCLDKRLLQGREFAQSTRQGFGTRDAAFFRRLAEGVFDQEDLQRRTQELAGFLAGAAEEYGFDPNQVIAVGYSNGANIAASLLLRQPETLAGAICCTRWFRLRRKLCLTWAASR